MTLKQVALSVGLAAALVGSHAYAQTKDHAMAMKMAESCDMDKNGMVTKVEYMKMMEMHWDKAAKGGKELSVANTAKIFSDSKAQ